MSEHALVASIRYALHNSIPLLDEDRISMILASGELTPPDVNDLITAVIRLENVLETKKISFKAVIARINDDLRKTEDHFAAYLAPIKARLEKAVKPHVGTPNSGKPRYIDMPAGRVGFSGSKTVEITVDQEKLSLLLMEMLRSKDEVLLQCVNVALTPSKNDIKKAIAAGKELPGFKVYQKDTMKCSLTKAEVGEPSESDDDDSNEKDASPVGKEDRGAVLKALGVSPAPNPQPNADSFPTGPGPVPAAKPPVLAPAPSPMASMVSNAIAEAQGASKAAPSPQPAQALQPVPPAPPVQPAQAQPAPAQAQPDPSTQVIPPSSFDASLRPRLYMPVLPEHFTEVSAKANREQWPLLKIDKMIAGHPTLKPEDILTRPITEIHGGLKKYFDMFGFDRTQIRTWIAYWIGHPGTPDTLDPAKVPEDVYRKLLALAIHGKIVREKAEAPNAPR